MVIGKSTQQVAEKIGSTVKTINTILTRHPELRPAIKYGNAYIWSDEEIDRYVNRPRSKGGRPAKQVDS